MLLLYLCADRSLPHPCRYVDSSVVWLNESIAELKDVAVAFNRATLVLYNSTWWVRHVY